MAHLADDRRAMRLHPGQSPWQPLPEMAQDLRAERTGMVAGLWLAEIVHHRRACRCLPHRRQDALGHLHLAMACAFMRANAGEGVL